MALALSCPAECGSRFDGALAAARWMVRDAAAGSEFVSPDANGQIGSLKLALTSTTSTGQSGWRSSCTVVDKTASDRAVTLALCMPLDPKGAVWWDDPQRSRPISGRKPHANLVDTGVGEGGVASRYPMAVISSGDTALCLAVPMEPPRMVRFVYDPAKRELRAEFDFGLSNAVKHFPSCADATVTAYEVPAKWAFRQALARYYELYPSAFARRVTKGGIWLPFQALDIIERFEDFGFAFHEVPTGPAKNVAFDEQHGVGSYIYTEPMTVWREFHGDGKRTYHTVMSQLWDDAFKGDRQAQAALVGGYKLADGRYFVYLSPVAYTPLIPMGANCDPEAPTEDWGGWPNQAQYWMEILCKELGWTGEGFKGLDGVYLDSSESAGRDLNYNRDHWRVTRCPLTFDPITHRIALMNFWGTYAFVKQLSEKLREKGLSLMANDAFYRFWQLAPFLDVPGREYSWIEDGKFTPVPDERYLFFRSMAAKRPYLMLMNNDFQDGSRMEEYFQRSLFYAVYPSMFHGHSKPGEVPYFYNPAWYNRDRHLFVKYIPLIRKLDSAGWEPVPYADAEPASIRIERYGSWKNGNLAFTLHNPSPKPQSVELILHRSDLGLPERISAQEWLTARAVPVTPRGADHILKLQLSPNAYAALSLTPN